MSMDTERAILLLQQQLESLRKADRPAIRLPYAQRFANPFPLASSGNAPGDFPQSGAVVVVAFNCSVFVQTTNSAAQFWTVRLVDVASNVIASFQTSAIAPNVWTRFPPGIIAQPLSTNVTLTITATATLSPGPIYVLPEVDVLM